MAIEQQEQGFWGSVGKSIITWSWTKRLLHWIITSAGTMSECAFLVASVWMSINANIHWFLAWLMGEDMTKNLTALSTMAYVVLPECIVGLAVITTLSHLRMVGADNKEWIWTLLFGLPALVFFGLSLYTLHCSVTNATFEAPWWMVSGRAIAGYMYAFTGFLYSKLGEPQMKDKLVKKDSLIGELKGEVEKLNAELGKAKRDNIRLENKVANTAETAQEAYSEECKKWLSGGLKSVSVDDINRFTGHSKQKINAAIRAGKLRSPGRNKELILMSSLIEWLAENPPLTHNAERETGPMLKVVES